MAHKIFYTQFISVWFIV